MFNEQESMRRLTLHVFSLKFYHQCVVKKWPTYFKKIPLYLKRPHFFHSNVRFITINFAPPRNRDGVMVLGYFGLTVCVCMCVSVSFSVCVYMCVCYLSVCVSLCTCIYLSASQTVTIIESEVDTIICRFICLSVCLFVFSPRLPFLDSLLI